MSAPRPAQCLPGPSRCALVGPLSAEREAAVASQLAEARALLEPHGLWSQTPLLALDAPLQRAAALTVADAAEEGLHAYAGTPVILLATRHLSPERQQHVLLHELTHVWMRTQGAHESRWHLQHGRARHDSALVHEAVAEFIAHALRPPAQTPFPQPLRCPDDLTGQAHADAELLAGALWALSESPEDLAQVLAALRGAALEGSRGLEAFVPAMDRALHAHPTLPARWAAQVEARGLLRCHEARSLDGGPARAWRGDLLAAGASHLGHEAPGPLHFTARVEAGPIKLVARGERDALSIAWRVSDAQGQPLAKGQQRLDGGPSLHATLELPAASHRLDFTFINHLPHDVAYNNVTLTAPHRAAPPSATPQAPAAQNAPVDTAAHTAAPQNAPVDTAAHTAAPQNAASAPTGCGVAPDLLAPLLLACLIRRRPQRR